MTIVARFRRPRLVLAAGGLLAAVLAAPDTTTPAADHRDGPIFPNTALNGQADCNDIYVFQAPNNPANTVMIFTMSPFPGGGQGTPTTFDPSVTFDIKVDNTGDAVEDLTYRFNFSAPDANGVQSFVGKVIPAPQGTTGIIVKGKTGTNIPIAGGGMCRAAIQDDPFFFDATGFAQFVAAGAVPFPRAPGAAFNFFGPDANTLAIALELPTARILSAPTNPNIGVFIRTERGGVQQDRMGRPAINTALIPPVPRNNMARGERRNAFNAGQPRNDRRDFRADMISVFTGAFGQPADRAASLADFLLPDLLTFNTSTAFTTNPADSMGFPNGRRLRDDVIDIELNLITNGAITTDNVADDNGARISDGTMIGGTTGFRPIAFPYIGPPNLPLNGPGNSFPRP